MDNKSKYEILSEHIHGQDSEGRHLVYDNEALKAMDEFARQQAMAFLKFRESGGYLHEISRDEYGKWGPTFHYEPKLSREQLYDLFIETQQNNG